MNKKIFLKIVILFVSVILIPASVIYFTFDMNAVKYLTMFKPWSIIAALGCLIIGLIFDGTRLIQLTKIAGQKLPVKDVFSVVLSNYFLALLTPGASGGAIAQVMFMKRAGIQGAKAVVIVFVRTIMSITFLIFLVPIVLHYDYILVDKVPTGIISAVSILFIALPISVILFMNTKYPEKAIYLFTKKFWRSYRKRILSWYNEFKEALFMLKSSPLGVLRAFIESGISLLSLYAVVPVFFEGFGLNVPISLTMGRMALLNLILYFSPTPGGSGIAEGGFLMLFSNILPTGTVGIMAVLWRLFCEYIPFLLGGIITIRAFGSSILQTKIKSE